MLDNYLINVDNPEQFYEEKITLKDTKDLDDKFEELEEQNLTLIGVISEYGMSLEELWKEQQRQEEKYLSQMKASEENEALKVKIREEEHQVAALQKKLRQNTDPSQSKKSTSGAGGSKTKKPEDDDEEIDIDALISAFNFIGKEAEGDIFKALDEKEKRLENYLYQLSQIRE